MRQLYLTEYQICSSTSDFFLLAESKRKKKRGNGKMGAGGTGAQIANRRFVIRLIRGIREIIISVVSEQLITVPDLCKMGRRPQMSTTPLSVIDPSLFGQFVVFRANRKEGSLLLLRMSFPHFLSTQQWSRANSLYSVHLLYFRPDGPLPCYYVRTSLPLSDTDPSTTPVLR